MRTTKNTGPFCWIEKDALKRIGETFGECGRAASARSVYLALCQIASDLQKDRFETAIAIIGARAGVSTRCAGEVLRGLKRIGLIEIETQSLGGMKKQSLYTLLAIGNKSASMGNNVSTIGNGQRAPLPKKKESKEESKEEAPIGDGTFGEETRRQL